MQFPRKIDLHMHTTVSDGTDTPEMLLDHVKEAGIDIFAVTDHDAVKGCAAIRAIHTKSDPVFLTGVEFSCRDECGQYHILGYGFDPEAESICNIVELGHSYRMEKVKARLDFLREEYGFCFPGDELRALLALDNPGKPHIGNLMVRYGYAQSKEKAIKEYIDRITFESEYVRPEEAIGGILGSGGIPVLAHPFYGNGDQLILGKEMDERIRRLVGYGLKGLEVFYSGFTDKMREQGLDLAEYYGLYVTAGSDYHGKNKLIPLGDTGLDEPEEWPEGLKSFLEDVMKWG